MSQKFAFGPAQDKSWGMAVHQGVLVHSLRYTGKNQQYLGLLAIGFRSSSLPESSGQKMKKAWRISIGRATAVLLVHQ